MPRTVKKKTRRKKRDWRTIVFWVFSLLVAISMAIGYILPALSR
jgi:fatty acid desaturase